MSEQTNGPLPVGSAAPDFTLRAGDNSEVTLSQLRGHKVVLAFYPMDWSPGCQNQMDAFSANWERVAGTGAQVFGISIDSRWSHQAWKDARGLQIPLLADFHPKGAVGAAYGVYNAESGYHRRTTFVIDEEGIITNVDEKPATDASGVEVVCTLVGSGS